MGLVICGWLSTYRTWQLSLLAFLAVYAPNFRLGTRVRHPFKKRPESRKNIWNEETEFSNRPKVQKKEIPHLLWSCKNANSKLKLQCWIKSLTLWIYLIFQTKLNVHCNKQHSGFDYNVVFPSFHIKNVLLCNMIQSNILAQYVWCFYIWRNVKIKIHMIVDHFWKLIPQH